MQRICWSPSLTLPRKRGMGAHRVCGAILHRRLEQRIGASASLERTGCGGEPRARVAIDERRYGFEDAGVIGVQLQSSAFFDGLSLLELLDLFAALYGRSVDAMALLEKVDLKEKARSNVNKLSGGQKQRFSIATALVNEPKILFLDEPTTGLDPQARRNLWELAQAIRAEGRTIVLTTHYMDEAETLCDRVAIMDHGKILAMEPPDTLIQRLLDKGFHRERMERSANLEDVFLDMTGHGLRES